MEAVYPTFDFGLVCSIFDEFKCVFPQDILCSLSLILSSFSMFYSRCVPSLMNPILWYALISYLRSVHPSRGPLACPLIIGYTRTPKSTTGYIRYPKINIGYTTKPKTAFVYILNAVFLFVDVLVFRKISQVRFCICFGSLVHCIVTK